VAEIELKKAAGLTYREMVPAAQARLAAVLFIHGVPESSYMWRHALPVVAGAGRRAIAPDLPGFGDSPLDPPSTWERQLDALDRWWGAVGLVRAILAVHDWGGLIGLRWALERRPDEIAGLVLSNTGFFPDGKWHGMAKVMRSEGQGEALMESVSRELFDGYLEASGLEADERAAEEYWKSFSTPERRQGILDLYRSGDFEKLEPHRGRLGELGVPTLILWGTKDEFAPVAGAHRFAREIEGSSLATIEEAGHFVWEDAPERCNAELLRFLNDLGE
jgi:haloalkane dehalogenase